MREELFEQETIDVTPTWAGLLPAMLMVLEQGNAKAKQEIKAELQRMARIADLHVAQMAEEDGDVCRECGEDNTGGEGYDGLCGNCADLHAAKGGE